MRIKKQALILILVIMVFPLLLGAGKKTVELLDEKKLIDLDLAIIEDEFGNGGEEETTDQDMSDETEDDDDDSNSDPEPYNVPAKKIVVTIHFEEITCDGVACGDVLAARGHIVSSYREGDSVVLVDDFAEAHIYNKMVDILDELKTTKGISYVPQ